MILERVLLHEGSYDYRYGFGKVEWILVLLTVFYLFILLVLSLESQAQRLFYLYTPGIAGASSDDIVYTSHFFCILLI
jgi:divalent metal cation (Fe/Co/Zn/Cd) transporter